jgi:hypothetical protein
LNRQICRFNYTKTTTCAGRGAVKVSGLGLGPEAFTAAPFFML